MSLLGMATGASLAGMHYLLYRGEVPREIDADGVVWYRSGAPHGFGGKKRNAAHRGGDCQIANSLVVIFVCEFCGCEGRI